MMEQTPKRLLIADDEETVVTHMTGILERAGYEIITAHRGSQVAPLAKEHKPDLIILDIVMPDMDGGEVVSLLSEDARTEQIPILYLTGIITRDEGSLLKKSGRHALLAKPITADELLSAVSAILSG